MASSYALGDASSKSLEMYEVNIPPKYYLCSICNYTQAETESGRQAFQVFCSKDSSDVDAY